MWRGFTLGSNSSYSILCSAYMKLNDEPFSLIVGGKTVYIVMRGSVRVKQGTRLTIMLRVNTTFICSQYFSHNHNTNNNWIIHWFRITFLSLAYPSKQRFLYLYNIRNNNPTFSFFLYNRTIHRILSSFFPHIFFDKWWFDSFMKRLICWAGECVKIMFDDS